MFSKHPRLSMLAIFGLWFGVVTLAAQDLFTLKVDVRVVSVDVTVTDSQSALVNTLTKDDFQIYEDGILQAIEFFSSVSAPNNILLLFDRSESTRGNRAFMQDVIGKLLGTMRDQDSFALASFDEEFKLNLRWSTDRTKAATALDDVLRPREGHETHFYGALDRSLRQEFKGTTGRRAIIVLTDGEDTPLAYSASSELYKALDAARQLRIPIHIIALQNESASQQYILPNTQTYLDTVQYNMQRLADASGGQVLKPKSLDDVAVLYEQIGQALGNSYSLGYAPSRTVQDRKTRRIEVRPRDKGLRVNQSRTTYSW